MVRSENDKSNKQTPDKNTCEETNLYEDEVNLIDYFRVLWKQKYFILSATVLPVLFVVTILLLWPRTYKVTYVYDVRDDIDVPNDVQNKISEWNLNEKNYQVLLSRFYSEENLSKLKDKFQKNELKKYAEQLNSSHDELKKLVGFEIVPPFFDISRLNITNIDQIDRIKNIEASLLNVTITGKMKEDMYKISSVIQDNIENGMLLYMAKEQLSSYIREYNGKLADIERNKFSLELALKNNNEILAELKKVNAGISDNKQDNIILQFNVGEQSQYLPLSYQIQAAEFKRIELEERIKTNEEKYEYYKELLDLNNRILAELNNKLSGNYSTEQFKSFLTGLTASYEKPQLKDYLSSYIKKIENRISASKPVTENPKIYPVAKGTIKKSGTVFAAALVISIFAAFLREDF